MPQGGQEKRVAVSLIQKRSGEHGGTGDRCAIERGRFFLRSE